MQTLLLRNSYSIKDSSVSSTRSIVTVCTRSIVICSIVNAASATIADSPNRNLISMYSIEELLSYSTSLLDIICLTLLSTSGGLYNWYHIHNNSISSYKQSSTTLIDVYQTHSLTPHFMSHRTHCNPPSQPRK
jgi:hypothetical protein